MKNSKNNNIILVFSFMYIFVSVYPTNKTIINMLDSEFEIGETILMNSL